MRILQEYNDMDDETAAIVGVHQFLREYYK